MRASANAQKDSLAQTVPNAEVPRAILGSHCPLTTMSDILKMQCAQMQGYVTRIEESVYAAKGLKVQHVKD